MLSLLKALTSRLQAMTGTAAKKPLGTANMEEIIEGTTRILHPKGSVFYNPAQVVNRDLSILVLRHFSRERKKPLQILEALSATGLRSTRYFKEIPNVSRVIANDLDPAAVASIRRTIELNGLDPETQVKPNQGDAAVVMTLAVSEKHLFDAVDLDPYGSAAPFIEPAIRCISDGGILCVTCTDLPVLCGNAPEICYGRYASTPLKSPTTHEMAVRIVFQAVQAAANRLGRAVEPVLCAQIDFYLRLFLRVRDSKSLAQRTPSTTSTVFQCNECGTQNLQPLGRVREIPAEKSLRRKRRRRESEEDGAKGEEVGDAEKKEKDDAKVEKKFNTKYSAPLVLPDISSKCGICGGGVSMGGPIWNGPLIGEGVAESLLADLASGEGTFKARTRIEAIIRLLQEEVKTVPLFMHLPSMCKTLNVSVPPAAAVRSVLVKKGYEVSQSHVDPGSLKTTAPAELVWDILRIWTKKVGSSLLKKIEMADDSGNTEKDTRRSAGERILAKEPVLVTAEDVDFSVKKDKFVRRGATGSKQGVRFPHNPEPNWGPKARAGKRQRRGADGDNENAM